MDLEKVKARAQDAGCIARLSMSGKVLEFVKLELHLTGDDATDDAAADTILNALEWERSVVKAEADAIDKREK